MGHKLYVGGLSFKTTDGELRTLFEQAGKVDSAVVMTDLGPEGHTLRSCARISLDGRSPCAV